MNTQQASSPNIHGGGTSSVSGGCSCGSGRRSSGAAAMVASGAECGSDCHQDGFRNSFVFVVAPKVNEKVADAGAVQVGVSRGYRQVRGLDEGCGRVGLGGYAGSGMAQTRGRVPRTMSRRLASGRVSGRDRGLKIVCLGSTRGLVISEFQTIGCKP
jgi:hypothetical protein